MRSTLLADHEEQDDGVPLFLDQLIKTLEIEQSSQPLQSRRVSGPSGGGKPVLSEIGETAARHERELLQQGFTVEQVVHDYGDLCQAITDLACECDVTIGIDEFRTLNRCSFRRTFINPFRPIAADDRSRPLHCRHGTSGRGSRAPARRSSNRFDGRRRSFHLRLRDVPLRPTHRRIR